MLKTYTGCPGNSQKGKLCDAVYMKGTEIEGRKVFSSFEKESNLLVAEVSKASTCLCSSVAPTRPRLSLECFADNERN